MDITLPLAVPQGRIGQMHPCRNIVVHLITKDHTTSETPGLKAPTHKSWKSGGLIARE